MATQPTRARTWRTWLLVLAALLATIAAIPAYMRLTAARLHPQADRVPSVADPEPPPEWADAVDRAQHVLRAALADQNLPGLSAAVGVDGRIVWAEGFGWPDLESRAPVTPSTRFRIGTASKALTSAAAGALLDQRRLSLDEEIQTRVPQFPGTRWPITLRQLMGDVSGLDTDRGDEGPLFFHRCERPVDAVQYFANGELLFEPAAQYRPSNYGWILVSAAIEAAADRPFVAFMRERVFEPLGMDHTGAEPAAEENPERIGEPEEDPPFLTALHDVLLEPLGIAGPKTPPTAANQPAPIYSPALRADPRHGLALTRLGNLSCYAGSMAFFSTPSDLVRFGLAMNGGTLLQPATVALLESPQRLSSGQETHHGLGWDLETVTLAGQPARVIGYDTGSFGGRMISLMTFPERGLVVSVMSDVSYADAPALALKIAALFAERAR